MSSSQSYFPNAHHPQKKLHFPILTSTCALAMFSWWGIQLRMCVEWWAQLLRASSSELKLWTMDLPTYSWLSQGVIVKKHEPTVSLKLSKHRLCFHLYYFLLKIKYFLPSKDAPRVSIYRTQSPCKSLTTYQLFSQRYWSSWTLLGYRVIWAQDSLAYSLHCHSFLITV